MRQKSTPLHSMTDLTLRMAFILGSLWWTTGAYGEPAFSPRAYCLTSGGAVMETGSKNLYLCCYAAKQHCLAVNTHSQISVPVIFPDDFSDSTEHEMKGRQKSGTAVPDQIVTYGTVKF